MICPNCGREMRSRLVMDWRVNGYVQVWTCDYAGTHGQLVSCANDCGVAVRNPREHYTFTDGVIGSGRWSCFRRPVDLTHCPHPADKRIVPPQPNRNPICGVCFKQIPVGLEIDMYADEDD